MFLVKFIGKPADKPATEKNTYKVEAWLPCLPREGEAILINDVHYEVDSIVYAIGTDPPDHDIFVFVNAVHEGESIGHLAEGLKH